MSQPCCSYDVDVASTTVRTDGTGVTEDRLHTSKDRQARRTDDLHVETAIDRVDLAGDVRGLRVGEELHHPGDLIGLAEPAHRDAGDELLHHVRRHRRGHV